MENMQFNYEELAPGVYALDNTNEESMYLINGADKSLLIDTGMTDPFPDQLLMQLGAKKTELALTHTHIDHMYHADRFQQVYISGIEQQAWKGIPGMITKISALGFGKKLKHYPVDHYSSLSEASVIDLGGVQINVLDAPGHTAGSCIFVDQIHELLFTGDAIGSGEGAWMWMPDCLCVSAYRQSLKCLLKKIQPYKNYRFLGGHRLQGIRSEKHPAGHLLNITVLEDMILLCEKLLNHDLKPQAQEKQFGMTIYFYTYGQAGMWLRSCKIK